MGSGELIGKPIALVNTSSRATHAWRSLVEILTVMSATIVTDASIVIPLDGTADSQAILGNPDLARRLSSVIEAIAGAGRESRAI